MATHVRVLLLHIIIGKNYFKSILAAVEAAANAYHVLRICWPIDVAAITRTHASPFVAERTLLFVSGVRVGDLVSVSLSRREKLIECTSHQFHLLQEQIRILIHSTRFGGRREHFLNYSSNRSLPEKSVPINSKSIHGQRKSMRASQRIDSRCALSPSTEQMFSNIYGFFLYLFTRIESIGLFCNNRARALLLLIGVVLCHDWWSVAQSEFINRIIALRTHGTNLEESNWTRVVTHIVASLHSNGRALSVRLNWSHRHMKKSNTILPSVASETLRSVNEIPLRLLTFARNETYERRKSKIELRLRIYIRHLSLVLTICLRRPCVGVLVVIVRASSSSQAAQISLLGAHYLRSQQMELITVPGRPKSAPSLNVVHAYRRKVDSNQFRRELNPVNENTFEVWWVRFV